MIFPLVPRIELVCIGYRRRNVQRTRSRSRKEEVGPKFPSLKKGNNISSLYSDLQDCSFFFIIFIRRSFRRPSKRSSNGEPVRKPLSALQKESCPSPNKVSLGILRRGKMVCTDLTWLFVRMSVCVQQQQNSLYIYLLYGTIYENDEFWGSWYYVRLFHRRTVDRASKDTQISIGSSSNFYYSYCFVLQHIRVGNSSTPSIPHLTKTPLYRQLVSLGFVHLQRNLQMRNKKLPYIRW